MATFYCDTDQEQNGQVVWMLNGSVARENDSNSSWKTYGRQTLKVIIFRNTSVSLNSTRIQCRLPNADIISNNATLLVQGVIHSVVY